MTTEHDVYGLTPEERAEFEEAMGFAWCDKNTGGGYVNEPIHRCAQGWAACAKLNREKLERLNEECDATVDLLTQIKNLEVSRGEDSMRCAQLAREVEYLQESYTSLKKVANDEVDRWKAENSRLANRVKELESKLDLPVGGV